VLWDNHAVPAVRERGKWWLFCLFLVLREVLSGQRGDDAAAGAASVEAGVQGVAAMPPPCNQGLVDMKSLQTVAIVMLLAGSATEVSWARTWRVELNGSGDFRDIQPAVEAASPGDTIRIGPGRFQQLHPIVAPAWTEETIIAVTKDNLTFIGAGADQTILGKTSFYAPEGQDPKGICSVDSYDVSISNLTIENMEQGIYWWQGSITISSCLFRGFSLGVMSWVDNGSIQDCKFEISNDGKALGAELTGALSISRCEFSGYGQGFATGASAHNVHFVDCEFRDNRTAMVYDRWSTGSIRNTSITGSIFAGIIVTYNSEVDLSGVAINGGEYGLLVLDGSVVTGSNVVIEGTSSATLNVASESQVTLNTCHLLPDTGVAVRTYAYFGTQVYLDLTGNFWGTTDADVIGSLILDSNDDPTVHCTVNFLPFADGPVPTEFTSWGDLKALFR
jgi:hypothetical protein